MSGKFYVNTEMSSIGEIYNVEDNEGCLWARVYDKNMAEMVCKVANAELTDNKDKSVCESVPQNPVVENADLESAVNEVSSDLGIDPKNDIPLFYIIGYVFGKLGIRVGGKSAKSNAQ